MIFFLNILARNQPDNSNIRNNYRDKKILLLFRARRGRANFIAQRQRRRILNGNPFTAAAAQFYYGTTFLEG